MSETINYIDLVCLMHGVSWSANPPHWAGKCLICALCFEVLNSTADCNPLPNGRYEDICVACAAEEAALNAAQTIARGEPNESEHHA
jgi:hypothetical protein